MKSLNLKELSKNAPIFTSGHRLCPGCGISVILRQIFSAVDFPIVIANATGCLEICSANYPYNSWNMPWIHSAFENAAATISGAETMYRSLKKTGKMDKNIKFLAIGGDGGTYDIGFQSLSGAMERGHDIVYLCVDNQAYMNTGGQRSSATPYGAETSTSPLGMVKKGKYEWRKDIVQIMAAHNIPYAAQASPSLWPDLVKKAVKAFEIKGPAYLNVFSCCPTDWHYPPKDGINFLQKAVDSCFWPLYEVEKGLTRITYRPKKKLPVSEWLKGQGRFAHLFQPENSHMIETIQKEIDKRWEDLLIDEEISQRKEVS